MIAKYSDEAGEASEIVTMSETLPPKPGIATIMVQTRLTGTHQKSHAGRQLQWDIPT